MSDWSLRGCSFQRSSSSHVRPTPIGDQRVFPATPPSPIREPQINMFPCCPARCTIAVLRVSSAAPRLFHWPFCTHSSAILVFRNIRRYLTGTFPFQVGQQSSPPPHPCMKRDELRMVQGRLQRLGVQALCRPQDHSPTPWVCEKSWTCSTPPRRNQLGPGQHLLPVYTSYSPSPCVRSTYLPRYSVVSPEPRPRASSAETATEVDRTICTRVPRGPLQSCPS